MTIVNGGLVAGAPVARREVDIGDVVGEHRETVKQTAVDIAGCRGVIIEIVKHAQAVVERRRHLIGEVPVVGGIIGPPDAGFPYREEAIVETHFERSLVVGILLAKERNNGLEKVDPDNQAVEQGIAIARTVFEALALLLLGRKGSKRKQRQQHRHHDRQETTTRAHNNRGERFRHLDC